MSRSIDIELFCFDASLDFLPHYRTFRIEREAFKTLSDLLAHFKETLLHFDYDEKRTFAKVNGLVTAGECTIETLVNTLGTSWRIEPLSEYRAVKGLRIDDSDFEVAFELIAPFADEEDRTYFETLYAQHYASESFALTHEYIGDAVLLCAHRIIFEKKSPKETEVLHAIAEAPYGLFACEFENNLFEGRDESEKIETLKAKVRSKNGESFIDRLRTRFTDTSVKSDNYTPEMPTAYYYGYAQNNPSLRETIANPVTFAYEGKKCGMELLPEAKELAYKKAGKVLLDAIDNGAEALIVESKEALLFLQKHKKAIARSVNRDLPIALVHSTKVGELEVRS